MSEGPYTVSSKDSLYELTRHELVQDYKEAVEEYRKAKQRVNAIRFAVRGLSLLLDKPIPEDMGYGPILPEEKLSLEQMRGRSERKVIDHRQPHPTPPGRSNLAPRDRGLSQLPDKPQGNKDDKV